MKKLPLLFALLLPVFLAAQVPSQGDTNITVCYIGTQVEPIPVNLDSLKATMIPDPAVQEVVEGKVVLRVMLDTTGHYVRHIVLTSADPALTRIVESKISALRFTPAKEGRKAIKCWITIPFRFGTKS